MIHSCFDSVGTLCDLLTLGRIVTITTLQRNHWCRPNPPDQHAWFQLRAPIMVCRSRSPLNSCFSFTLAQAAECATVGSFVCGTPVLQQLPEI